MWGGGEGVGGYGEGGEGMEGTESEVEAYVFQACSQVERVLTDSVYNTYKTIKNTVHTASHSYSVGSSPVMNLFHRRERLAVRRGSLREW